MSTQSPRSTTLYRLASDESGMTHVLNRTRALCGMQLGMCEAEVDTTSEQLYKLLLTTTRGCLDCGLAVTGAANLRKRGPHAIPHVERNL